MRHYTTKLLFLCLLFPFAARATSSDETFLTAREAFRVGSAAKVAKSLESLRGYELEPWVEMWSLRLKLDADDSAGVKDFLERWSGSLPAERLRADWLKVLGQHRRWDEFLKESQRLVQPDQELVCYGWQARWNALADRSVLDEVRPVWLTPAELPEACAPLTDLLVTEKRLSADDVWMRIRRLLEDRKTREAVRAARYLPDAQIPDLKTLESIAAKPTRYLDKKLSPHFDQTRLGRELAIDAWVQLARTDPQEAAERFRRQESRLSAPDRAYVWGQLALQAARRHLPEAGEWFDLAEASPLNDEQQAWRVRAALRQQDWAAVRRVIERMSPPQSVQPDWVYWLARALAAQGRRDEAARLYQRIADQPSFYGNLACEELGRPIAIPARAPASTSDELDQAAHHPGLRRALAFFRLDMRVEGVREWNWSLRGMDDRQLLAAAELARRNDILDRTISTADRTVFQHDYGLRYPAPFRDQVSPKARELALDDGWVYGLMRQESRFVSTARSGVGAKGLMQLMPATARWVARKIGLSGYRPDKVTELDTNVTLGTNYLRMVFDSLGNHPVLACAAYNAGPGRAQRWRGDRPLEGAIYAETIPFNETRDYVKKVMSNSVYYAALFEDRPQSLKARLGIVQPAGKVDSRLEELP